MNIKEFRAQNPAYDDMSDTELAKALHGKFYSDMPYSDFAKSFGVDGISQSLQDVRAGIGPAARAAIQGVANIPGVFIDPFLQMAGINSSPRAREQALTRMGLPEYPADAKGLYDAAEVVAGAGGIGAASKLSNVAKFLGDMPVMQGVMSYVANKAQDVASGMGIQDPLALGAIGMTAGVGTGAVKGGAGTLASRSAAALTDEGQQAIGGTILRKFATNPETAANYLANAKPTIPGSMPMTAGASRDMGLAGLESAVRGLDTGNLIGQRISANNVARLREFDRIAGTPAKLEGAIAKRGDVTTPMREDAFAAAGPLDADAVMGSVQKILNDPSVRRGSVFDAVKFVTDSIKQARNADGSIDPQALYAVRKDMRDAAMGKFSGEKQNMRLANKELESAIRLVDDAIESAAPGYKGYMARFAKQSGPINQMETLQGMRQKVVGGVADTVTGEPMIKASSLRNEVAKLAGSSDNPLSPTQNRILDKLVRDIDMGMAATAPGVKVPGSDTFKNMTFANIIGRTVGGNVPSGNKTLAVISAPFKWMSNYTDDEVRKLLVDAMLDPQLASSMMRKASLMEAQTLSNNLKRQAQASGLGAVAGLE